MFPDFMDVDEVWVINQCGLTRSTNQTAQWAPEDLIQHLHTASWTWIQIYLNSDVLVNKRTRGESFWFLVSSYKSNEEFSQRIKKPGNKQKLNLFILKNVVFCCWSVLLSYRAAAWTLLWKKICFIVVLWFICLIYISFL